MSIPKMSEIIASGRKPEEGENIACEYCGNIFQYSRRHKNKRFCSPACKGAAQAEKSRRGPYSVTCPVCGKSWKSPHPRYVLCSNECRAIRAREHNLKGKPYYLTPEDAVRREEMARYESEIRRGVGRTAILADLIKQYVEKFPSNALQPPAYKPRSKRHAETMVVLRGDLHPGLITPSYNIAVFRKRMEIFTQSVLRIREIISETIPLERLVIIDLGDNITGQGIFPNQPWSTEETVMRQIYHVAAPAIIEQNMAWLSHFPTVVEYTVPGNHGKTGKEHPEEANWDNVLSQEIAARMENIKHFAFAENWNWWTYVDIYGWRFLALHGHQIRSWLNIPFYGLVNKGMRWQGSMPERWDYLVHGHFHVAFSFPWNNFEIIGNGSLVSDDEFALRELGMASMPAQQVFGVHPEHGITWKYTLRLS